MKILINSPIFYLIFLGILSLGLIYVIDRGFFDLLSKINSPFAILADLRITSLIVIISLYLLLKKMHIITIISQPANYQSAIIVSIIWLVMTAYFVLIKKVWVPTLSTWVDYTAFMIIGLLAEEILFRGILFDLSTSVFNTKKLLFFSYPVIITSILFGLSHLSYHGFKINSSSITQVVYTFMMGIVFAYSREATGSLMYVILLHMLNNSFTLIRTFKIV